MAHGQLVMGRAFLALESGNWDDPSLDVEVDFDRLSPMHQATERYIRARRALARNDLDAMERTSERNRRAGGARAGRA